jgi:HTH-type transcriptional regulator, glycine betaine synthesis regulator
MTVSAVERSRALFIGRWGEMAASWGISRTMAEIHALLFISRDPLCTDDLMEGLQISRGNASMNLRQLLNWGLIHRTHRRGDRKEYFLAECDVWQMFEIISRERRRREIEPIIETIAKCREMLDAPAKGRRKAPDDDVALYDSRLRDMQDFFSVANTLFNVFVKSGRLGVGKLIKTLSRTIGG